MVSAVKSTSAKADSAALAAFDWHKICHQLLTSRAMDSVEEERLVPEKKVLYQFSARGHDVAQVILGSLITGKHDAVSGYYRSRPLMLALGLPLDDGFASPLMRAGGYSDGRDIGVVFNLPNTDGPCGLPMAGGVGAQYTPIAGWAQAIKYRRDVLKDKSYDRCIAVAHGGDASVATNGFWSALTIATTEKLPMLFYIEDNGYGISVPTEKQTPGANIAANLAAFKNLKILDEDGTDVVAVCGALTAAVGHLRNDKGPVLVRLKVPRLSGHSAQDTQTYKSSEQIKAEQANDPLPKLKKVLIPDYLSEKQWQKIEQQVEQEITAALDVALARPEPDSSNVLRHVFFEENSIQGGLAVDGHKFAASSESVQVTDPARMNMLTAIRRTLDYELDSNNKLLLFGEDIGPKGGVHAATIGLQDKYGDERVFDTSLSEEGIIGRAVGMAMAGLMPVAEIQFRKYADPAEEQLNDCGTVRWRTDNHFSAPIVVRIPGGFFKCGDPWHSQCNEVKWVHAIGWQVAMPSNAEDAVGLLRAAMRSNNPTIFFEHRSMLDDSWARRPYPGDEYVVPFGKAKFIQSGDRLTVVSWGAMVPRCEAAAKAYGHDIEIIDLRTLMPWDESAVLRSIEKTGRCLIVHEDNLSAGFGAEIAAVLVEKAFTHLDAPVKRLTMPDIPSPHSPKLLNAVVPSVEKIAAAMQDLLDF